MRVRKIVTRSGRRFRGKFPSLKLKRMVHWESFHERDTILHLEYHPLVVNYQEQPSVEIYYDEHGEARRYVPDFLVVFADGRELLIEVKPKKKLADPIIAAKLGAVAKRFEEQGRPFRVLTEEHIRRQPLFGNLQRVHSNCKPATEHASRQELLMIFGELPAKPFGPLAGQLGGDARVFRLLRSGVLRVDLERELTNDSAVFLGDAKGGPNGSFCI
jgi:TnsA endonuclease N terminal